MDKKPSTSKKSAQKSAQKRKVEEDSRNTELDILPPEKVEKAEKGDKQEQNKAFFKQRKTPVKAVVKPAEAEQSSDAECEVRESEQPAQSKESKQSQQHAQSE